MKLLKLFSFIAFALSTAACASLPNDIPGAGSVSWPGDRPGMINGASASGAEDIGADLVKAPFLLRLEKECRRSDSRISLDKHVVGPLRVLAGDDVSQSFTYTLCGRKAQAVDGKLVSRIYHGGRAVSVRERDYHLALGRWDVRFEATVPSSAPTGAYEMELQFKSGRHEYFKDRKSFRLVK